jgi:hypothetical protein
MNMWDTGRFLDVFRQAIRRSFASRLMFMADDLNEMPSRLRDKAGHGNYQLPGESAFWR